MILAALATLGATVVAFVLYPVFAQGPQGDARTAELAPNEREIVDLEEKKARLYEALTDLDFEKAAGKVSESDYLTARNDYMSQVAEILARVEALAPGKAETKKRTNPKAEKPEEEAPSRKCASCEKSSPEGAQFCIHCGAPLSAKSVCAGCGKELPGEARFCMACGKKVSA